MNRFLSGSHSYDSIALCAFFSMNTGMCAIRYHEPISLPKLIGRSIAFKGSGFDELPPI